MSTSFRETPEALTVSILCVCVSAGLCRGSSKKIESQIQSTPRRHSHSVSQLNERQPFIDKTDSQINRPSEGKQDRPPTPLCASFSLEKGLSVCIGERERKLGV